MAILIAEDNADTREALRLSLQAEGYAVRVTFVSHRKGRRQMGLPLSEGKPAPLPEPIKPRPVPLPQPKPYSGAARELAAVGLEAGAVDDRIDAEGAE